MPHKNLKRKTSTYHALCVLVAPSHHILSLKEKHVSTREERDALRTRLEELSEQNQQDLAEALERLSLEMEEKGRDDMERLKLEGRSAFLID